MIAALGVIGATLVALAALRWLAGHTGVRSMVRRLDELRTSVADWQSIHSERMVGLDQQMGDIERSVGRAEDSARSAARNVAEISRTLQRLDRIEQRAEIEILIAQGRIPQEHVRDRHPDSDPGPDAEGGL